MTSENKIKKYIVFIVLTMATGVIYRLPYIQDIFYVPVQESLNLTHTQIGNILSISGFFSVFGFLGSIYFIDRISKKILIPCGLIGVGITGIYLSTFPDYNVLILIWISFALFSDMLYWPVLVKSIKELANSNLQGRIFGFFEAGRGLFDTVVVLVALYLFSTLGSLKYVILFYSSAAIVIGIVSFFVLEKDEPIRVKEESKLGVPIEAIKSKKVWLVAGNIFCAYSIYCGLTYMMPFLQNTYNISVLLIGVYGMINQYGIKMIAGPLGGYLADKKFKSTSKYFRFSFISIIFIMIFMIILSKNEVSANLVFMAIVIFSALVNSMKALLFAPMQEVGIEENISGAAISLASFIGYSPLVFSYSLYGSILDKFEGLLGYKILFSIIIAFGFLGLLINKKLMKVINLNRDL